METQSLAGSSSLTSRWDESIASALSPLERLVYRSNILGDDHRVTNTGGGNTSAKIHEKDPLTGETVEVLWVKGSGGDLRTAKAANFASLFMDKLVGLKQTYADAETRGVKSAVEDAMVAAYAHCTFNLNPRASSIDTPLHAFLPARHVDHTHPNAVIAIAASRDGERLTQEVFGDEVAWVPWMRPGFELGLRLEEVSRSRPGLRGIILGGHGLINWADDDRECYELSIELINKAARHIEARDKGEATFGGTRFSPMTETARRAVLVELLPCLRGRVSANGRQLATVESSESMLRFVDSADAPRLSELGTSCPDHFLRTKIKPMYIDWDPASADVDALKRAIDDALVQYRSDYKAYYDAHCDEQSPAMRDPNPTVVLIPGLGMIAWGKTKSESRVTAEFYNCAVEVMRGAEAVSEYVALPAREAFDIEYWALEEAKLRRMPSEAHHARDIVLIVGAGGGIGRASAHRLGEEGAHVVCADLNAGAARDTAGELTAKHGLGIGLAGSGISSCGPAIDLAVDVTDRASVQTLIDDTVLAYGGVDHVIVTAGLYALPSATASSDEVFRRSFDINVVGCWRVAEQAGRVFADQALTGSIVLTTSVNGVVPKKGSFAYDTSKAAANHLVRELALEFAPNVRVNGVAPATVVEGSAMFPRDRVLASLAKYEIAHDESESTDALRDRLARFYSDRTLLREPVRPGDQAEAIAFLVSDRSCRTTGQIISVDGGLAEAFMR